MFVKFRIGKPTFSAHSAISLSGRHRLATLVSEKWGDHVTLGLTYNFGNAWSKNKKIISMGIVPKCRGGREGTSCVQENQATPLQ